MSEPTTYSIAWGYLGENEATFSEFPAALAEAQVIQAKGPTTGYWVPPHVFSSEADDEWNGLTEEQREQLAEVGL